MKFSFNESPNTAVITCCHVIEDNMPILYVSHDADDGMWQFLCGKSHATSEARVVSLDEILKFDKTLSKLSDLPCGFIAERNSKKDEWHIKRK